MADSEEFWYRYEDVRCAASLNEWGDIVGVGPLEVRLRKLAVVRHTPKGVWLSYGSIVNGGISTPARFVLREANKRYACPTVEEAKVSFIARKRRQLAIHAAAVKRAEEAIAIVEGRGLFAPKPVFA